MKKNEDYNFTQLKLIIGYCLKISLQLEMYLPSNQDPREGFFMDFGFIKFQWVNKYIIYD